MLDSPRLKFNDLLLLFFFTAVLLGYCCISGRPLTMHEARLPETSREMKANGNWLLPRSGGRPWLERPPLPHWVEIGAMKLLGHDDRVWIVRLPSAVLGTLIVLMISWSAGKYLGRIEGVLCGLALATSLDFYQYAGLAEDDIYLAFLVVLCMWLFMQIEFDSRGAAGAAERIRVKDRFFGNRSWKMWLLFIFLGLTNLTKGPLVGMAIILPAILCFILWECATEKNWALLRRFAWLWGWVIVVIFTLAWPLWAHYVYPDVLANWKYDYLGRVNGQYTDINQPGYYYLLALGQATAPWIPACLIGLAATAGLVFKGGIKPVEPPPLPDAHVSPARRSAQMLRLVWCWAIVPLIVLSIPKGKHHHYLLPVLAAWAVLASIGLIEIAKFLLARKGPDWLRDPFVAICVIGLPGALAIAWFHIWIPGPAQLTLALLIFWPILIFVLFLSFKLANGRLLAGTIMVALLIGYCWGETFLAPVTDHTLADTAFLCRVRQEVPADQPLFVNAKLGRGNLDFFRIQFYLRPDAKLLHNLSYLRDENIKSDQVYIITRALDEAKLRELGTPTAVDRSDKSHEERTPEGVVLGPFTLFKLKFDPDLKRYPAPAQITTMQAMERGPGGPWCGPPL